MRAVGMAAPNSSVQATARPRGTCLSSGAAGGSLPVTSFQPSCSPLRAATIASSPAGSFTIRLLRGSRLPGIGVPQVEVAGRSWLPVWPGAGSGRLCRWPRGNKVDAYLMAIMRAVVMAAPSSSVQATAWPRGTCLSSGAAGGSLPVTRLQPSCSPLRAATTATSPAASFSVRLARPSPLPGIGASRDACHAPRIPQRPPCCHRLTAHRWPGTKAVPIRSFARFILSG